MSTNNFKLGEKYKSYSAFDLDKTGKYDIFEVIQDKDGELAFLNHTDKETYALYFLGYQDLVKIND